MSARTILTVTMNPAIDVSASVDHVVSDRKLRCSAPLYEPGGGGINVARAVRKLGGESTALFPVGGPGGRLLQDLLRREGVVQLPVPVEGWTRENLNVLEEKSGRQFRFVLPGPLLAIREWEKCLEIVANLQPFPEFLVASGSLPPGVPDGFYGELASLASRRRARILLDASGSPLRHALEKKIFLWKPSLREFQDWAGEAGSDEDAWRRISRRAVAERRCEVLVLSLGAGGVLWTSQEEQERLAAPAVRVSSTVGAGDSLLAGIVFSLAAGRSLSESVRFGVAAAAAAVLNPGTGLCQLEDVRRLEGAVAATSAPLVAAI